MTVPQADSHDTQGTQLSADEYAALDREDAQAGMLIGRLLAFFFFYTVVVTVLAAWWTWAAIRS